MEKEQASSQTSEQFQKDIQDVVQTNQDVKESVRCMTIKALTDGDLDMESARKVADAVIKGAKLGAAEHGLAAKDVLAEAVLGLDEALSKAAEASTLALQESIGRAEDFSSHDLKKALGDIQGLDALFKETLIEAAEGGKDQMSAMLRDLAEHAQHSGAAVGQQFKEGLDALVQQVADINQVQIDSGVESIKTTGSLIARIAAGMLEGIADSMEPTNAKANNSSQDKAD